MKDQNLIIRIPEPCHEDWNNMTPDNKGRFCSSCSKSVIDFSNKTDVEIHTILTEHKDLNVCGHFKKTQINRPLNFSIDFNNLPKNISSTKAFAIAVFLVFGTFLFSCTNPEGKKVDTIEVVNNKPEEQHMLGFMEVPLMPEDTLPAAKTIEPMCYNYETHVAGGLSIESIPPTVDSILVIEPQVVEHLRGEIMMVPEPIDTAVTDSSTINDVIRLSDQPVNTQQTIELSVYPNPGNGEFTLKYDVLKRADVRADLYNINGALLKTLVNVNAQFEGKYTIPVNVSDLPNGIYIISLINNGKRFTDRLIIEK